MAGAGNSQNKDLADCVAQHYNAAVQWIRVAAVNEVGVSYRECRRNHAASMGCYATDGCGEFLKAGKDGTMDAFLCAACGCHRSFHRKELLNSQYYSLPTLDYVDDSDELSGERIVEVEMKVKKKGKRTKLSPEQKNKMKQFAEKLGWRPQKHDEEEIEQFCDEVGISQKIFKVWLCNNRRRTERCCVVTDKNQGVEE